MTFTDLPLAWLPLADAVAKTTVILIAATVASLALRRASAALRHLVWTLALCSALLLPVLSVALPKWQLPLFTIATSSQAAVPDATPVENSSAANTRLAPPLRGDATTTRSSETTTAVEPTPARRSVLDGITWQSAVLGLWLAGAFCILARVVVGLAMVSWLSRRTQEITDASWLPMARAVAAEMGVTSRLRFLRSGRATMPVATGIFRPSVIMPTDADTWSASRLRVVVLHELAHVKRRDCLTHVLAQAACAFHWFNPLAWLAVKRARTERERACDDLVLSCGTRGSEYADQLLEMARVLRGDRFPALIGGASLAMAHRSQLEGRLIAILDPRVRRAGLTRGRALAAVAVCCCAVAPLGALQPWTSTENVTPVVEATRTALAAPAATAAPAAAALTADLTRPAGRIETPAVPVQTLAPPPVTTPSPQPAPMPMLSPDLAVSPAPGPALPGVATPAVDAAATAVANSVSSVFASVDQADPKVATKDEKPAGGKADPRMVAALTAALKDSDKEVRETAMQALVQLRDPSIFDPLVQALKDGSADVREQAAFGLGQMRDRRAVQPLLAALKDENADVREQVVFALGQIRDPSAVDALAVAVRDANPSVREQAVFALGQIRDRRAVEPLISALKDANAEVREQAAFGLGQIRDPRAVEALIIAVRDADNDVREQVVFALGQLRDARAIDALTTALKDQNAEVRKQAAFALGQLAR